SRRADLGRRAQRCRAGRRPGRGRRAVAFLLVIGAGRSGRRVRARRRRRGQDDRALRISGAGASAREVDSGAAAGARGGPRAPAQGSLAARQGGGDRMEMKRVNAGSLRAIGYDETNRALRVELGNGTLVEYSGVSLDTWRRFSTSASMWSFFRDNIEEN